MFTPVETGIGALLLHQATSLLLFQNGAVLGVSGFLHRLFHAPTKGNVAFFVGMAASFLPLRIFIPELATDYPAVPCTIKQAIVTLGVGVLVGLGTKLSSGCTSGHMLCGMSRLSARSAVAVATFFPVAILTHHLVHPSLLTEVCTGATPCYMPTYPSSSTTAALLVLASITIYAARTVPSMIAEVTNTEGKSSTDAPARLATQLFAGLEFGLGLHISQMSHPSKVLSFLSFPNLHVWDPSLLLIVLFGILPSMAEIQIRGLTKPPSFGDRFRLPTKTLKDVDRRFILGAAIFGIGWGLTGTCPGPAVLRAFAQPSWGLLWMGGFWLGGKLIVDG